MEKNINEIPIKATPTQSDKIIGFDNATGEAIAVPISAIARQGTNGQSLEVQYSQDGEIWHYPGEATDIYMRQRIGSASWGATTRINVPDSTLENIRQEIEVDFTEKLQDTTKAQKKYTDDAISVTEANIAKAKEEVNAYTDNEVKKVRESSFENIQIIDDSFANSEITGVFFFQGFKAYKFKGDIIYSENLILTSNIDPMHGYGEQTYKWITSNNTWRIIGRIKKGAEWGRWIEYNTNP